MNDIVKKEIHKETDGRYSLWYRYADGTMKMHKILHPIEAGGLVNKYDAIDMTGEIPKI